MRKSRFIIIIECLLVVVTFATSVDSFGQFNRKNIETQDQMKANGYDPSVFKQNYPSGVFTGTPSGITNTFTQKLMDRVSNVATDDAKKELSTDLTAAQKVELLEDQYDNCVAQNNGNAKKCIKEFKDYKQAETDLAKKKDEFENIDCKLIENAGKTACQSAKGYKSIANTASQMTTAYSSAVSASESQEILNKYQQQGAGLDASQAQLQGMRSAVINADQASNRQAVIGGIGGTIATANYAAAYKADRDYKAGCVGANASKSKAECDALIQAKIANTTAGMGAFIAAVPSTMQAFQEKQTANMIRGDMENYKKWMAANKGSNTVIQYEGMPQQNQYPNPNDDTTGAQTQYNPNGVGLAGLPADAAPQGFGGVTWADGAPGSGGGGGGSGSARGASGGGMAPYTPPPMDPNAGKPTYANVDESGGGYRAGVNGGNGAPKLDMNSMLAQYLPKEGDKLNENGVLGVAGKDRAPASESSSLLDASVNIFERISDTYSRKAKSGAIKL